MSPRPCEIDEIWPLVRTRAGWLLDAQPGLEEDLLRDCAAKLAFCFRSDTAAAVLSLSPAPSGEWHLFVRFAISLGEGRDVVHEHMPFLEQLARDLGASEIRFRTTRRGWLRYLDHSRWRVAHVEFATPV
jgi:hypothetical protein